MCPSRVLTPPGPNPGRRTRPAMGHTDLLPSDSREQTGPLPGSCPAAVVALMREMLEIIGRMVDNG